MTLFIVMNAILLCGSTDIENAADASFQTTCNAVPLLSSDDLHGIGASSYCSFLTNAQLRLVFDRYDCSQRICRTLSDSELNPSQKASLYLLLGIMKDKSTIPWISDRVEDGDRYFIYGRWLNGWCSTFGARSESDKLWLQDSTAWLALLTKLYLCAENDRARTRVVSVVCSYFEWQEIVHFLDRAGELPIGMAQAMVLIRAYEEGMKVDPADIIAACESVQCDVAVYIIAAIAVASCPELRYSDWASVRLAAIESTGRMNELLGEYSHLLSNESPDCDVVSCRSLREIAERTEELDSLSNACKRALVRVSLLGYRHANRHDIIRILQSVLSESDLEDLGSVATQLRMLRLVPGYELDWISYVRVQQWEGVVVLE